MLPNSTPARREKSKLEHMGDKKLVSVLLPVFNAELWVGQTIESVLNQSYNHFELLICDDASTDATSRILDQFQDPRILRLDNKENTGYLETINKLLTASRGDFITFVDADDWIDQEKLSLQIREFSNDNDLGLCGTNFNRTDSSGRVYFQSDLPLKHPDILSHYDNTGDLPVCGASVMIKRSVLDKIGGYREYFKGCQGEDIDWILRILGEFKGCNINEHCYFYRFHFKGLTRTPKVSFKQRYIMQVINILHKQRQETGVDQLMEGHIEKVDGLIEELALPFRKNPSLYNRTLAFEYAMNKQMTVAFQHIGRAFLLNPFSFKNIIIFFCIIVLLIVPSSTLLRIKAFLKFDHISEKIS